MNSKGIAFSIDAFFAVTIIMISLVFLYSMISLIPSGSEQGVEMIYQKLSDDSMMAFYKKAPENIALTVGDEVKKNRVCVGRFRYDEDSQFKELKGIDFCEEFLEFN